MIWPPMAAGRKPGMMDGVAGTTRGHRALPHTADVILEAWGPDLPACCEQAVAALVELYADPAGAQVVDHRSVRLPPGPPESVVLGVLGEVIYALDTSDAVPVRAQVNAARDGGLELSLALAAPRSVRATGAVPKAVSRSGLEVEVAAGAARCRFLVDV